MQATPEVPSPRRALLLVVATCTTLAGLGALLQADLSRAAASLASGRAAEQPFEVLLVWTCEAVALAVGAWLTLLALLVVADTLRGRPGRRAGCPVWLHRAVLAACGVGVAATLAGPASAAPEEQARTVVSEAAPRGVDGLSYPDRPEDGAATAGPPAAEPARRTGHVVRPGDTLWDIAAAALPPGASDAEITARWQRLYHQNAGVLGPDPDLIRPGTPLRLPDADTDSGEEPRP